MENLNFLFAAYAAVWVVIFAYVVMLTRRHRALRSELEELRRLVERRGGESVR